MKRIFCFVQVLDVRFDAAFKMRDFLFFFTFALIGNDDFQPSVQIRKLTQAVAQRLERVGGLLEDLRVGLECDLRAALLRRAGDFELARRRAALIALSIDLAVAPDLELERPTYAMTEQPRTVSRGRLVGDAVAADAMSNSVSSVTRCRRLPRSCEASDSPAPAA